LIQAVDVNLASDVAIMDLKNLTWDYPHPLKDDIRMDDKILGGSEREIG